MDVNNFLKSRIKLMLLHTINYKIFNLILIYASKLIIYQL